MYSIKKKKKHLRVNTPVFPLYVRVFNINIDINHLPRIVMLLHTPYFICKVPENVRKITI